MIKYEKLPDDIDLRIPLAAEKLEEDPRVVFAYLFGSHVAGFQSPLSDIDIAVYLSSAGNEPEAKLDIFTYLSNALGTDELDLVILKTAPVSLTGRVLSNRRVIVDKEPFVRHEYESIELRKFFDFSHIEKRHMARRYRIG